VATPQASTQFRSRGLKYRIASSMKELSIRAGSTTPVDFEYVTHTTLLPQRAMSVASKHIICVEKPEDGPVMANLPYHFKYLIPVSVALNSGLQLPTIAKFKLVQRNPGGKFKIGYINTEGIEPALVPDFIREMTTSGASLSTGVAGKGFCVNGLKAYNVLSKLIGVFLSTQRRDGFTDATEMEGDMVSTSTILKIGTEDEITVNEADDMTISQKGAERLGLRIGAGYAFVRAAANREYGIRFGSHQVMETDGHIIPYAPRTFPGDGDYVADVLARRLFPVLGKDENAALGVISMIAEQVPVLARLEIGEYLLFLLTAMDITMSVGGLMSVMLEGVEMVAIVIHTDRPISVAGVVWSPIESDNIRSTLESLSSNASAVRCVVDLLSSLDLVNGGKVDITAEEIDTPAALAVEISKRKRVRVLSDEQRLAIKTLSFDGERYTCSLEEVISMLHRIKRNEMPRWFKSSVELFVEEETVLIANLSCFGEKSVSLRNSGGAKMLLYSNPDEGPGVTATRKVVKNEVVSGKGKNKKIQKVEIDVPVWDRVCFSRVDVKVALQDMRGILSEHFILQISPYDSRTLGDVEIHSLKGMEKEWIGALREYGESSSFFGKRKRGLDGDEEEREGGVKLPKMTAAFEDF